MKFPSYINALLLKSHLISLNQNRTVIANPPYLSQPLFQEVKSPQLTDSLCSA